MIRQTTTTMVRFDTEAMQTPPSSTVHDAITVPTSLKRKSSLVEEEESDENDITIEIIEGARRRKQSKTNHNNHAMFRAVVATPPTALGLPVELWAEVINILPYSDVLTCGAVDRTFLNDVMPLITNLEIFHPQEMHVAPMRRFPGVTRVDVNCLIRPIANNQKGSGSGGEDDNDVEDDPHELCTDTVGRLLPFLTSLPNLEEAWIGWSGKDSPLWDGYDPHACVGPSNHEEIWRGLIRSACGAYRTGQLRNTVHIEGLVQSVHRANCFPTWICHHEEDDDEPGCALCREVCWSLPLDQVLRLSHHHESDILSISDSERLSIIASRPGGVELLSDPFSVAILLDKGKVGNKDPIVFHCDDDGYICVDKTSSRNKMGAIQYSERIFDELRSFLAYGCDLRETHFDFDYAAYILSWAFSGGGVGDCLPTTYEGKCFIEKHTYQILSSLGFVIKEADFIIVDRSSVVNESTRRTVNSMRNTLCK